MTYHNTAVRSSTRPVLVEPRTPSTQLEIAAHWPEEAAAMAAEYGQDQSQYRSVARECKAVAYQEGKV